MVCCTGWCSDGTGQWFVVLVGDGMELWFVVVVGAVTGRGHGLLFWLVTTENRSICWVLVFLFA